MAAHSKIPRTCPINGHPAACVCAHSKPVADSTPIAVRFGTKKGPPSSTRRPRRHLTKRKALQFQWRARSLPFGCSLGATSAFAIHLARVGRLAWAIAQLEMQCKSKRLERILSSTFNSLPRECEAPSAGRDTYAALPPVPSVPRMSDSAGMPSPSCRRRIMGSVKGRLRPSTS